MLYPSVDHLKTKIDSKYSLVSVASKRARQLQEDGGERLTSYVSHKQVGKALEEIAAGALINLSPGKNIIYKDEV
ncbi:DNA-directed RNA polymerase subunit omega [Psychrobacillus insolitus]|uniref:DNA-directed RNA polymerase subunit omega n=1 Tax=Psychrobacillus insolitus TaxID=1461 RepID=A0A2W7NC07_9BACI|nr:DNA-directed RNA polymerase subunit omega [Psychrobacillus insolitus]PZX07989.1 DNA-directed RNA polymerase subunit omega [Psychrobacillus insolitus]